MNERTDKAREQCQVQRQPVVPHTAYKPRPVPRAQIYLANKQAINLYIEICELYIYGLPYYLMGRTVINTKYKVIDYNKITFWPNSKQDINDC